MQLVGGASGAGQAFGERFKGGDLATSVVVA
jgi:hypothetical protein